MPKSPYDVIVIGAGPAGYVCAIRASQLGLKTAVVEREFLGGVCLNVGCIPSKALLRNAEVIRTVRGGGKEFGFETGDVTVDYSAAVRRSRRISGRMVKGVEFLLKKNAVDVIRGAARITGPGAVTVAEADGDTPFSLTAKHIVVATGAQPASPPGIRPDGIRILTYREAILREALPSSAVIVGGGPIGLEFAALWNAYGVRVTIVEMLARIAPLEDEEVSAELTKAFGRLGIEIRTGCKVQSAESAGEGVRLRLQGGAEGEFLEAGLVLVAVGFRPNSDGLGLESLGVAMEKNRISVDGRMATNVPGIWAIGDVTGKLMLAHVGSAMGLACAEAMAGQEPAALDYEFLPRAVYSHPQAGSLGLTESQAAERGYTVKVARFPFQANGKALGIGEHAGWVKLIADQQTGLLLGAHLVGPEVSELLPELTLAQRAGLGAEEIARNIHAHPTLSESLMEAAHGLHGGYLHL
ncbi:MAG: dihydrolipoyl dehydrogenase [Anaerolineales bacterium]|nr:dihydrolipoyl dehydrogenase [Anaerolineales bacterium]